MSDRSGPGAPSGRAVEDRERLLRELAPRTLNVLVRRGADFATAEDAVQEAILKALGAWTEEPPQAIQAARVNQLLRRDDPTDRP